MTQRKSLSMHALQRADQRLGWVACALLQPIRWLRPLGRLLPRRAQSGRVLLIKFWGIGSLQLLTPSLRTLRWRHPGAELVLLTLDQNRQAVEGLGVFDRVITLEVGAASWLRIFSRIARAVAGLRREHFDEVYDFEFFTRFSALISLATGSLSTHGFATNKVWRGAFHHREVLFNRYWHVARNFRLLAGGEDGRAIEAGELSPVGYGPEDSARVEQLLEGSVSGFCVLNPNAGTLSLERRWPVPSFAELAARLVLEDELDVILVGSASEQAYTAEVRQLVSERARPRVRNLSGALSATELAALFARAAVVVSNDSGPMHLAAALGAPTVGLFGPETPVMYAPLGVRAQALYRPTACSPCINVHDNKVASCIYGRPECLVNIPVDEVLEHARALMHEEGAVLTPRPRPLEGPTPETLPEHQPGVARHLRRI